MNTTELTLEDLKEFDKFRQELTDLQSQLIKTLTKNQIKEIESTTQLQTVIKVDSTELKNKIKKLVHLKGLYELLLRGSVKTIDDVLNNKDATIVGNIMKDIDSLSEIKTSTALVTTPVTPATNSSITTTTMTITSTNTEPIRPNQPAQPGQPTDDGFSEQLKKIDATLLKQYEKLRREIGFTFPEEIDQDYDSDEESMFELIDINNFPQVESMA